MANRAKNSNIRNHIRQRVYANEGIIMIPTLAEEKRIKDWIRTRRRAGAKA